MSFLTDITLGQYYPIDSFIHRLDPRTKIMIVLLSMATFVFFSSPVKILLSLLLLVVIIGVSRIPVSLICRNLRPFRWLFLLTIILNLLFSGQDQIILTVPVIGIHISRLGLINAILYPLRLITLILLAAILTLTTSPLDITDALDRFLRPLRKLGLSTHEFTMMITLSLRFIPTLIEEADKLQKAQISRGATFEGHVIQRVKSMVPLILPLFVAVFRRADELALAMDARCYVGGTDRTNFKHLVFTRSDYLTLGGLLVFLVLFLFLDF